MMELTWGERQTDGRSKDRSTEAR